jgi:hypothetical protein
MVVVGAAIRLPLIIIGTMQGGLIGLAWAIAISLALEFIVNLTLTVRLLEIKLSAFWRQSWRPLLAVAIMGGVVRAAFVYAPAGTNIAIILATLVVVAAIGAIVSSGALLGLWRLAGRPPGAETTILAELKRKLLARRDANAAAKP